MKKNIKNYIFILTLIISIGIFGANYSNIFNSNTVFAENDFSEYAVEIDGEKFYTGSIECESEEPLPMGSVTQYLTNSSYLNPSINTNWNKSSYNVRDYYYLTCEDQQNYGMCWAFSSLKSVESFLSITFKDYYNFSETWIALAYKKYSSSYNFGDGGHHLFLCNAVNNYGIVYDCDMPFEVAYNIGELSYNSYYNFYSDYANKTLIKNLQIDSFSYTSLSDSEKQTTTKYLKNYLVEYGAFTSCVKASYTNSSGVAVTNIVKNTYYTDSSSPYYNSYCISKKYSDSNHQILIIGWDDNYVSNFDGSTTTGAWIAQNSWGETGGKYFYIPYSDSAVYSQIAVIHGITYNGYAYDFTKSRDANYSSYKTTAKLYLNSSNGNYSVLTHKNDSNYKIPRNLYWYSEEESVNLEYKYNGSASNIGVFKGKTKDVSNKFTINGYSHLNDKLTITSNTTLDPGTYIVRVTVSGTVYENTFVVYNGINIARALRNNFLNFGDNPGSKTDSEINRERIFIAFTSQLSGKTNFETFATGNESSIIFFFSDYCTVLSYGNNNILFSGAITGNNFTTGSIRFSKNKTADGSTEEDVTITSLCGNNTYTFTYHIKYYYIKPTNVAAPVYVNYATGNSSTSFYNYELETQNFFAINMTQSIGSNLNSQPVPTPTAEGRKFLGWYTDKNCSNKLSYTDTTESTIPYSSLTYSNSYSHIGNNYIISSYDTSKNLYQRSIFLYPKFSSSVADISSENFIKIVENNYCTESEIELGDFEYTGEEIKLNISLLRSSDSVHLTKGADYTVSYSNNISIGTATCIIKGINNYFGMVTITFNITKANNKIISIYFDEVNRVATATAKYGTPSITYSTDNVTFGNTVPLVSGIFYVKARVEESTLYKAVERIETFNINKNKVAVPVIVSTVYNGELQIADITDTEYYTVTQNEGGVDAGTYLVVLTLKDFLNNEWQDYKYSAELELEFEINKAQNEITSIVLNADYSVSATAKVGVPVVEYANKQDMIYSTVVPHFNGEYIAKAYVYGLNNYEDVFETIEYSILDRKNEVLVPEIISKVYNGETQIADITNTEYYTVVENNGGINAGEYNVILSLINPESYEWTYSTEQQITITFIIEKAQNQILTFEQQDDYSYIATALNGTPTIVYSLDELDGYSLVVPKIAGLYYVKAFVEESENYLAVQDIKSFSISKIAISSPELASKVYNKETQVADISSTELYEVISNNGGKDAGVYIVELKIVDFIHYEWKDDITSEKITLNFEITKQNNAILSLEQQNDYSYIATALNGIPKVLYSSFRNEGYTLAVPKISGVYYVKAFVEESKNYFAVEEILQFTIEKQTISIPQIPSKEYNGKLQFADILDTEFYIVLKNYGGVNAGIYYVELSLLDFIHYEWENDIESAKIVVEFQILKTSNQLNFIVYDWNYGEEAKVPYAKSTYGMPKITYSSNGTSYNNTIPENAGTYYVKATVIETINYDGLQEIKTITISKKTLQNPEIKDKYYNKLFQTVLFKDLPYYAMANGGINVGNYPINIVLSDTQNYEWANSNTDTLSLSYNILQASNSINLTVTDWLYLSEDVVYPYATATFGEVNISYSINLDNGFVSTIPTRAGTYYVKAEVEETSNYKGANVVKQITIHKIKVESPIIDSKVFNNETQVADITSTDIYSVTKNNGGISAGTYVVNLTLSDYVNYEWQDYPQSETLTLQFDILQAGNNITLSVTDWKYQSASITPNAVSTYGIPQITYSQSLDGEYTETVPENAGTYYVKAEVKETINYVGVQEIKQLVISPKVIATPILEDLTYTGQFQKAEIENSNLYMVIKNYDVINVGTYYVEIETINNNYIFDISNNRTAYVSYNVCQANNSLEISIENWTYGNEPSKVNFKARYGEVIVYYISENGNTSTVTPTNVGSYVAIAQIQETPNYKGASASKEFIISKQTFDTSNLIFTSKEYVYDGKTKNLTVMGKIPEDVEISYSNNNQKNVGVYEVIATFSVNNPNYNEIEPLTAILTIKQKELTSSIKSSGLNFKVDNVKGFSPTTILTATKNNLKLSDYKVIDAFTVCISDNNSQVDFNSASTLYISLPKTITQINYRIVSVNSDNTINKFSYSVNNGVVKLNNFESNSFAIIEVEEKSLASIENAPIIISITTVAITIISSIGIGLIFLKKKILRIG